MQKKIYPAGEAEDYERKRPGRTTQVALRKTI
jgi:hypothetical protein